MKRSFWIVSGIVCALGIWTATLISADTLVMRNGNRISGRLIGLRDGVFEFEEDRGNRRRVVRVEQIDVRTIELDQDGPGAVRHRGNNEPAVGRPRGLREREVNVTARYPSGPTRASTCGTGRRSFSRRAAGSGGAGTVRMVPRAKTTRRAIPAGRFPRVRPRR